MKKTVMARSAWLAATLGVAMSGAGCAEGPPRPGPGGSGGPPTVAIDACAYKVASERCYFEDGRHAITGTCQERGRDWVCVPDREPPGGSSAPRSGGFGAGPMPSDAEAASSGRPPRPPREAVDACRDLSVGSACVVATSQGDGFEGRCAYSSELMTCIPGDPGHRPDRDLGALR
ncbi:hypothetical protein [Thiocystis violacea]|uniref:hypothetical protein n=1 Tax=Thiocystis violacea TaxID=13725 RepID=UPI00190397FC|nr:hypothetical protein [Thiocystis violacea]